MFLDWIAQLGLFQHDEETNILASLPLPAKKTIISTVVNHLTETDTAFLTSHSHVRWMMEVIGQGLSLPMEDYDVILRCINIYKNWLQSFFNSSEAVPRRVLEQPQQYYQTIFQHYSLLFFPRKDPTDSERHAELCEKVLDTLYTAGKHGANVFSMATWECLLKVCVSYI
eukprot:Colp12_sorted_trinity150504_noHs@19366